MGRHRKTRPRPERKTAVEPVVDAEPLLPATPPRRRRVAATDDVVRRIDETLRETGGDRR